VKINNLNLRPVLLVVMDACHLEANTKKALADDEKWHRGLIM
jgi:hypothetical protein